MPWDLRRKSQKSWNKIIEIIKKTTYDFRNMSMSPWVCLIHVQSVRVFHCNVFTVLLGFSDGDCEHWPNASRIKESWKNMLQTAAKCRDHAGLGQFTTIALCKNPRGKSKKAFDKCRSPAEASSIKPQRKTTWNNHSKIHNHTWHKHSYTNTVDLLRCMWYCMFSLTASDFTKFVVAWLWYWCKTQ